IDEARAVQVQTDAECLGQLAGSGAQLLGPVETPARSHQLDALDRLERPNQHRRRMPFGLRDEIQETVYPVREIYVHGGRRTEQHAASGRRAAESVAGPLVGVVAL